VLVKSVVLEYYFLQTLSLFPYNLAQVLVGVDYLLPTTDCKNSYYITFQHFEEKLPETYTTIYFKVQKEHFRFNVFQTKQVGAPTVPSAVI
jgi:hypothetical protein